MDLLSRWTTSSVSLTLLVAACVVTASPAVAADVEPEVDVVASYRDGMVTRSDYESWLRHRGLDGESADLRSEIDQLVFTLALVEAAEERGALSKPKLRTSLAAIENEFLTSRLRREAATSVQIETSEVEALLEEYPDAFHRPRKVRLRSIFKRFPPDADAEARARVRAEMEQIEARLRDGASFEAIARVESDSETRFRGGLIGNVEPGTFGASFDTVLMRLQPGELSEVIESAQGLTILRCDDVIPGHVPTREEALTKFATNLKRVRQKESWERLEAELLASARPVIEVEVALDTSARPESIVLRWSNGQLTRAELIGLLALRRRGLDPTGYKEAQIENILRGFAINAEGARRARASNLVPLSEMDVALRWRRAQIVAAAELTLRLAGTLSERTDEEKSAYYQTHRADLVKPQQYDLSLIRLTAGAGGRIEQEDRVRRLWWQLEQGDLDFATAARQHSDHPSADVGGSIGWVGRRDLVAFGRPVWHTVQQLAPGEISNVVVDGDQFWLLQVGSIQDERQLTFEEAESEIEEKLGRAAAEAAAAGIRRSVVRPLDITLVGEGASLTGGDRSEGSAS